MSLTLPIQAPLSDPSINDEEGSEPGVWYLFNDFVVKQISEEEALSFPGKWKASMAPYMGTEVQG